MPWFLLWALVATSAFAQNDLLAREDLLVPSLSEDHDLTVPQAPHLGPERDDPIATPWRDDVAAPTRLALLVRCYQIAEEQGITWDFSLLNPWMRNHLQSLPNNQSAQACRDITCAYCRVLDQVCLLDPGTSFSVLAETGMPFLLRQATLQHLVARIQNGMDYVNSLFGRSAATRFQEISTFGERIHEHCLAHGIRQGIDVDEELILEARESISRVFFP